MRNILTKHVLASWILAFPAMVLFTLGGCGGDGGGSISGSTSSPVPAPTPAKSVVITGTVPGTVAIAYDYATGMEAARDVASGTPKTFTLNVAPGTYYLMFLANEGTPTQGSYAFRNVTGGNVFTLEANTILDLGVLVYTNYPRTAKPLIDPISGNGKVTESFEPEASFSPGDGRWVATKTFVSSTCSGHSPGTTVTENVTIYQGYGLVAYEPAGTNEVAIGFANVNTAILTADGSALETIYLTMQSDGSLAGAYSKVGYGGECSEDATITAVLATSPPPAAMLAGISINGPSSMPEQGTATYTATASWSDGSTSTVTPIWSVSPQVAEISPGGVLSCPAGVASDQTVTIAAAYSSGGITKSATMTMTITRAPFNLVPITDQELSGKAFFQSRGSDSSLLYKLNADSSLELYLYVPYSLGDRGYSITGTWTHDTDGLFLDFRFADMGPYTVERFADSSTEMQILIHEPYFQTDLKWVATWEKIVPVDPGKLSGTYVDSVDGNTWGFNADGTGTCSISGGITFAWSVDPDGVLRMSSSTGHTVEFYARATSQTTATGYTILKVGFVELAQNGAFFKYYGGCELTRQ